MGYYAAAFTLSIRTENNKRFAGSASCYRAQDSKTFLAMLSKLWGQCIRECKGERIKKVSVLLHELKAASTLQPELFSNLPEEEEEARFKAEKISYAMDKINHRFGRDSVLIGLLPSQGRSFSGTKIAFTRIPDKEEFLE